MGKNFIKSYRGKVFILDKTAGQIQAKSLLSIFYVQR